jgi:hypothetical protein
MPIICKLWIIPSVNISNRFPETVLLLLLKPLLITLPLPHPASSPLPVLTRPKGTEEPKDPFHLLPLKEIPWT